MFYKNKNLSLFITLGLLFIPVFAFAQVGFVPRVTGLGDVVLEELIGNIIQLFLGFLGLIALVIVLLAGFKWMTSGGNQDKIDEAKKLMKSGLIGLLIIIASYAIASFLMRSLISITGNPNEPPDPNACVVGSCYGCLMCESDGQLSYNGESCGCSSPVSLDGLMIDWWEPKGSDVSLCEMIQVGFSSDVASTSVNTSSFKVYECNNSDCTNRTLINGELITTRNIVQFKPSSNYKKDSKYYVDIPTGLIKDTNENLLLLGKQWTFETGSNTNVAPPTVSLVFPTDNTEDVCLNSYIKAEFSKRMDAVSMLNENSFQLYKQGGTSGVFNESTINFQHKISSADTLFLKLESGSFYEENSNYAPLLNADILQDSCGNKLDGNANGASEGAIIDNYPPNNDFNFWNFLTGKTRECKSVITSTEQSTYYDGDVLTITGNYLDDSVLVFNNRIVVDESDDVDSRFCMDESGLVGVSCSKPSWWNDEEIKVRVPASGGLSDGAKTGEIKLQTFGYGDTKTSFTLLSPRIEKISPDNGGKGQFITIKGLNFADIKGDSKVYFRGNDDLIEADLPCSSNSWKDNMIIISVPETMSEYGVYDIQVKKVDQAGEHWSNMGDFEFKNQEPGPGLCSITPEDLNFEDGFLMDGKKLGKSSDIRKVIIGNDYNFVEATNPQWSGSSDNSEDTAVSAKTPNLASGEAGVRVVVGDGQNAKYSNFLSVNILEDENQDLKISYITPNSGPAGSYVTVYGSGFGALKDSSTIKFKRSDTQWVSGDFNFPAVCSTNYWRNDRIIVKVPQEFENIAIGSLIKVVLQNGKESTPVKFDTNTNGLTPSLCSISPESGTAGNLVDIFGEYFSGSVTTTFNFSNNAGNNASIISSGQNIIRVSVPETQTGLVSVSNSNGYGNTVNFEYTSSGEGVGEGFDYYGWHFKTCENCKIPKVKLSPCSSSGTSSPSPFPGSQDAPKDLNIYVEFEYGDGTPVEINQTTLNPQNIKLYKCTTQDTCSTEITAFAIEKTEDSLLLNPSLDLESGQIYKVVLSSAISDVEGSSMTDDYVWFFATNPNNDKCNANKLKIYPENKTAYYEASALIPYTTQVWDTKGCYVCNNTYTYSWTKNDINNLVSFPSSGSTVNTSSSTKVKINPDYKVGTLDILTNNSINLSASTSLKIIANCQTYGSDQNKCIVNSCCWNSNTGMCQNMGSSICANPFVKQEECKTSGDDVILGSPSPKYSSKYRVPINAHIFAKFRKSGANVSMNQATYNNGVVISYCGNLEQIGSCVDVTRLLNPSVVSNLSSPTQVNYQTSNFLLNSWYEVRLKNTIQDVTGKPLQEEKWQFRTGTGLCTPTRMSVDPRNISLGFNETSVYTANCFDDDCSVCDDNYRYEWIVENPIVASLVNSPSLSLDDTSQATVKSKDKPGQTKIIAQNTTKKLTNFSNLNVVNNTSGDCVSINNANSCNAQRNCCWNGSSCLDGKNNSECTIEQNCASLDIEKCIGKCCWGNQGFCTSNLNNCQSSQGLKIVRVYPSGSNICPNTQIKIDFSEAINPSTIAKSISMVDQDNNIFDKFTYHVYVDDLGGSTLIVELTQLLKTKNKYTVFLDKGIKSQTGANLSCDTVEDEHCYSFSFETGASVCNLDDISIVEPKNNYYQFNQSNQQKNFVVEARSSNNQIIWPIKNVYDWNYKWQTFDNTIVSISSGSTLSNSIFKSNNKNGKTIVSVTASKLSTPVGYNGPDLDDKADAEVFICENPWPALNDADYNFTLKYCMDGGLPSLNIKKVDYPKETVIKNGLLREYILTYVNKISNSNDNINNVNVGFADLSSNSFVGRLFVKTFGGLINDVLGHKVFALENDYLKDVIGIRIYKNDSHLSPSDWYYDSGYVKFLGKPKNTSLDSYSAIKDGRTIYVNAGNKVDTGGSQKIYSTVYLMSYNDDASPQTDQIVGQLMKNWSFNTNMNSGDKASLVTDVKRWEDIRSIEKSLDNYANSNKYCAYIRNPENGLCKSVGDIHYAWRDDNANGAINNGECYGISSDVECSSDSECVTHEMQFDKCIGVYPELNSGTYKRGISVSTWPSWKDTLSNEVGTALPVDPINKMGACSNADPITCWNSISSTFSCPRNSYIYYYKTINSVYENLRAPSFNFYALFNYGFGWMGDNYARNRFNSLEINNCPVCGSCSGK